MVWKAPLSSLIALLPIHRAEAADITLFCKCLCSPNVTILTVPSCAECSKVNDVQMIIELDLIDRYAFILGSMHQS